MLGLISYMKPNLTKIPKEAIQSYTFQVPTYYKNSNQTCTVLLDRQGSTEMF